ncbi:hypothetical protein N9V88_02040 [bacterium]|nr:hypothetical protein [bacterium]
MAEILKVDGGFNGLQCRARRGKSRRGNAVVFVGMMLPVMCGFIALGVDYGFLLFSQSIPIDRLSLTETD